MVYLYTEIFTRLLNARIIDAATSLVTPYQRGFMPGRFIGVNELLTCITMEQASNRPPPKLACYWIRKRRMTEFIRITSAQFYIALVFHPLSYKPFVPCSFQLRFVLTSMVISHSRFNTYVDYGKETLCHQFCSIWLSNPFYVPLFMMPTFRVSNLGIQVRHHHFLLSRFWRMRMMSWFSSRTRWILNVCWPMLLVMKRPLMLVSIVRRLKLLASQVQLMILGVKFCCLTPCQHRMIAVAQPQLLILVIH